MTQEVKVKNFPKGDSVERVAFEIACRVEEAERHLGNDSYYRKDGFLNLFAECLDAAKGRRDY